jgi:hypothetical protein
MFRGEKGACASNISVVWKAIKERIVGVLCNRISPQAALAFLGRSLGNQRVDFNCCWFINGVYGKLMLCFLMLN